MPSCLMESMRTVNEKLDKLEVIIRKKNYINANQTTTEDTHPTEPPSLNEPPLRDEDYITYYTCLTPIWKELWAILNSFNVNTSFTLISDEVEKLRDTKEGHKVENCFSMLAIKLDCMLFSADLTLKSNTVKTLTRGYPWTKTIEYSLTNYISKTDQTWTFLRYDKTCRNSLV